jgi:uncharacterized protein (DUF983 family)
MLKVCPACGLRLERNEEADYWVGGYLVNFIGAELMVAIAIVLFVWISWPAVHWNVVLRAAAALALVGPLLTWPLSKVLWLGLDLILRPPEASDFLARDVS